MSGNNNPNETPGGRKLGGGDAEGLPESWNRPQQQPRFGRIGEWSGDNGGSGSGSGGAPRFGSIGGSAPGDDSDGEDDDGDKRERWFAGGERSGLSIENPGRPSSNIPGGDMVRNLLRRAAEAGAPPVDDRSTAFSGGGHRLGGEEVESSYIPDPNAPDEDDGSLAIRHITFWREGFTVEDGDLFRYDDPANAEILAQINAGRAPPSILNVHHDERVELRISKRIDESYVPPSGAKVFSGAGNRLGAPVPSISGASSASGSTPMPGSFPSSAPAPTAERDSVTTHFEVDQTLPTTSVQIRLADGTRIVCRMNLVHKVRDLRNFIDAARPENRTRSYTIGTTFPNRTLDDLDATIEGAGLVNSVVVQRWS